MIVLYTYLWSCTSSKLCYGNIKDRTNILSSESLCDAAAKALRQRVPKTITLAEFNACRQSCTLHDLQDALEDFRAGLASEDASTCSNKVARLADRIFAPLRRFQSTLDTISQVHPTTTLLWGCVKFAITVRFNPDA